MLRFDDEPAYVLHSRPYMESSLILEVLTANHGRLSLLAKGVKRPKSTTRGLLQAFVPLRIQAAGKTELLTLKSVESIDAGPQLSGQKLLCGLYLNELLLRLVSKHDPQPPIFALYAQTLSLLSHEQAQRALRLFERDLLSCLGYQLNLSQVLPDYQAIDPEAFYLFDPEQGPQAVAEGKTQDAARLLIKGSSLEALDKGLLTDPRVLQDAKRLLRQALQLHLGPKPLETRRLL